MDRVSNLPDEIFCHILSFLTTNEAVLTSILSKSWHNLFELVPNLNIDDYSCLYRDERRQSFMDFVDRVLALQGTSPIEKFSLKCRTQLDSDRMDGWISNVLARGVSEFDLSIVLDIGWVPNYRISPKGFESKKLVKLKIGYDIDIDIGWFDERIFLPVLKTLVLESVRLSVDKFEILLHALPALEELVLDYIQWEDWDVSVSSASLKTLTINNNRHVDTFSFDTPSLVYFSFSDHEVADDYSIAEIKNLFEARISIFLIGYDIYRTKNNDWSRFANAAKLMNGIRNVRCLYLSSDTFEVLSLCCELMPVFNNLKTLTIESDENRGWQAMPVLLRNCPNLQTLVLEGLLHQVTDKCGDACDRISREEKGRSLTYCPVKMLEIKGFRGTTKEMHMIKHFSYYFPCLKEIKIYIEENGPTQLRFPEVSKVIAEVMEPYKKSSSRKTVVFNHLLLIVSVVFFSSLTMCS